MEDKRRDHLPEANRRGDMALVRELPTVAYIELRGNGPARGEASLFGRTPQRVRGDGAEGEVPEDLHSQA